MRTIRRIFILATLAGVGVVGCASHDWMTYRFNALREGNQRASTPLSDPARVPSLDVRWQFPASGRESGSFYGSPIVVKDRVFIGSTSGYFYALNAATGALLWQFPAANQPPLLGSCSGGFGVQTFGRYGIMSSASYDGGLVIFGAPDPNAETGMGSARLFALNETTGALVWASDVVAHVTGCNPGATNELHERIAYSSPLVFGKAVYVGVHDSGDDPIQNGKLVAVDAGTGKLLPGFSFASTSSRGGGIWNSAATDLSNILFTTGNTDCGGCQGEPATDHGLSMMKVDPNTGAVLWQFQPVSFDLDDDADWSAGVTMVLGSCAVMAASVQKDGWSYAVDTQSGACRWQFPATAGPSCKFPPGSARDHGDTDYKRPGAAWGDVLAITTGGEALLHDGVNAGYGRLHALNACATDPRQRVRWIADVPNSSGGGYALGAPTVSGGIFYVTTDQGYVVALADPAIASPGGYRCSDIDISISGIFGSLICQILGYSVVPAPQVLAHVQLWDKSDAAGLRNEAAISNGRLFVGTLGGHVYMLSAAATAPPGGATNACGGSNTLYAPPGGSCSNAGQCGRWKCVGKDAVTCDTSAGMVNACGGCSIMPIPGTENGRGASCICNTPGREDGILVCSADKNHLICCPCGAAPGCGPGSP
jgi:outer membrane protein assembly factor BamB